MHSDAIFGGICHSFRRALSSMVSLYSANCVYIVELSGVINSMFVWYREDNIAVKLDIPLRRAEGSDDHAARDRKCPKCR
jgi:hypothetical protein